MTWTAVSVECRMGSEPVGLPELGERVLGCTVARKPFPSDAMRDAFKRVLARQTAEQTMAMLTDAGVGLPRLMSAFRSPQSPIAEEALALFASGALLPSQVISELAAAGLRQQYSVSTMIEMFRVDLADKPRQQQATESGWASDAFVLSDEWGTAPSHWMAAPEPPLP